MTSILNGIFLFCDHSVRNTRTLLGSIAVRPDRSSVSVGSDVNGSSGSPKWVAVATGLPSDRSKQNKHNVGCILSQQTAVTDIIAVYWFKHQKYSGEADAKWKCRVVSWHDQWQAASSTSVKIMYQLEPNQQAVSNYSVLHISCEWACSLYHVSVFMC